MGDGIRTRDVQIHSLALYQLSYTHHNCEDLLASCLYTFVTSGGERCQSLARSGSGVIWTQITFESLVIPAKAGDLAWSSHCQWPAQWIPAFAGMTAQRE